MNYKIRSLILISLLLIITPSGIAQTGAEPNNRCVAGDPSAPVKIEVFSCYQCPPCRDFYLETIRPLLKNYADNNKACVVYYEFPLKIHDYARDAARYGEAARRLGQDQWQRVSEALYQHLAEWRSDRKKIKTFVAGVLSSDEMEKVMELIKDPSIEKTIDDDIAEGHSRHIKGTPTYYIYAKGKMKKIFGTVSYPVMKDYIDRLLK